MKAAILTFNQANNFGAQLQSYALQKTINELGHDAYQIRVGKIEKPKKIKYKLKALLEKQRIKAYASFMEKYIRFYPGTFSETNIASLNKEFDAFVSGSDQVWNMLRGVSPVYFQRFVRNDKLKISYAASIGLNQIPEEYLEESIAAISDFDYISVREQSARIELEKYIRSPVSCNIDLVFLISAEQWSELVGERIEKKPYIFVYGTQMSDELIRIAHNIKKETGLKIISVFPMSGASCVQSKTGPLEFVNYVKNAEYIVTTSFHCTAFSMIFEKRIIELLHSTTGSRAKDLLHHFGQADCIVENSHFDLKDKVWNYEKNAEIIEDLKKNAVNYLNNALSIEKKCRQSDVPIIAFREKYSFGCSKDQVVKSQEKICTGCSFCVNVCPKEAITMQKHSDGFLYPEINPEKCVQCGLCHKLCPSANEYNTNAINCAMVYAVRSKKNDVLQNSSSGGAFVHFSNWILNHNGTVYGSKFDDQFNVVIGRADTIEGRDEFRGSKYVQGTSGRSYKLVEQDLLNGKWVLFSGTPCQVHALKSYLMFKKGQYKSIADNRSDLSWRT